MRTSYLFQFDVVDQARLVEKDREGDEDHFGGGGHGLQRGGVDDGDVVDAAERGLLLEMRGDKPFEGGGIAFAIFPCITGDTERGVEGRGLRTFLLVEIDIAAAHGEAVGFAHDRVADDRDGEREVFDHAADDRVAAGDRGRRRGRRA